MGTTYYYPSSKTSYAPYLAHYGVKGMKWGVRHEARKDAKEYQKARMATGVNAGNRRKKIKNRIERNRTRFGKRDYNKAFDYYNKKYEAKSDLYAVQDTYKHNAQTAYKVGKRTVYTVAVLTGRGKDLIRVVNKGIDAVEYRIRGYRYV